MRASLRRESQVRQGSSEHADRRAREPRDSTSHRAFFLYPHVLDEWFAVSALKRYNPPHLSPAGLNRV